MQRKAYERVPLTDDGVSRYVDRIQEVLACAPINGWEEGFLSKMLLKFCEDGKAIKLTDKQWAQIERILSEHEAVDL